MKRVYLAGAITTQEDHGTFWRDVATDRLSGSWEVVNPLKFEADITRPQELVRTDLDAIRTCDAILANVITPSWGTAMELFWAARTEEAPDLFVFITGYGLADSMSPWLKQFDAKLAEDIPDAIAILGRYA